MTPHFSPNATLNLLTYKTQLNLYRKQIFSLEVLIGKITLSQQSINIQVRT